MDEEQVVNVDGVGMSISEAAKAFGIPPSTLRSRWKKGLRGEKLFRTQKCNRWTDVKNDQDKKEEDEKVIRDLLNQFIRKGYGRAQ